ncbi:ribonuclease H-like domain-containing protein [Tanacetum coccineum]
MAATATTHDDDFSTLLEQLLDAFNDVFENKFHADGTLSRYKACLVANGRSQKLGVDFDEMFSPVVKPATVRTVLSLVVSRKWSIHQLDVKNAFLNDNLSETRSLYGLRQAPRGWFQRFTGYVTRAGFYHSRCDSSLFICRQGSQVAYLLIYVDDIILTTSSPVLLQHIIDSLHNKFDMTNLGALNYFLGISTDRPSTGLFLSQRKYAFQLLERAHMVHCNPSQTPIDTESKLGLEGVPVQDPTLYRSLAEGATISYSYSSKFVLCRLAGNVDFSLQLYASATISLVGYTDANWEGCPSTRSAEAEYRGVANVVADTAWLHNLPRELHSPLSTATLVYCDNVSVIYMSANPIQHQRTKHIMIDIHFVRDMVTACQQQVAKYSSCWLCLCLRLWTWLCEAAQNPNSCRICAPVIKKGDIVEKKICVKKLLIKGTYLGILIFRFYFMCKICSTQGVQSSSYLLVKDFYTAVHSVMMLNDTICAKVITTVGKKLLACTWNWAQ